jgi:hypothetical protein
MDGFPIFDYTPAGLLGLVVLLTLFGRFGYLPTALKSLKEENAHLRAANEKLLAALESEQKTGEVVRRFFEGLEDR